MYRLKSVATLNFKPPERSKKRKKKGKKKGKKEESHQKKFPLYPSCAMVNICACVCAFGSHAKGLPGATPVLGTAIPSPTSQLIAARRISPFAKAEFSLPIFLWSRPRAGSGEKARPSPTRPGGFALLFTSLPSPGPPAVLPHTHSREKALKNVLFVVVFQKTSASPLGVWQRPRTGASSVGVLLLLLAGEAGQPGAHQHGRRRTPARAVVGPADVAGPCKENKATRHSVSWGRKRCRNPPFCPPRKKHFSRFLPACMSTSDREHRA